MHRKDFQVRHLFATVCALSVCWLLSGCRGHGYELAPVEGTVLCDGEPMSPGSLKAIIIFSPIGETEGDVTEQPGKAATSPIDANGKFVLSTFGDQDGAIVGKHRVRITIAEAGEDEEEQDAEASQGPVCGGLVYEPGTKTEKVFEVVAGQTNNFTIDITK